MSEQCNDWGFDPTQEQACQPGGLGAIPEGTYCVSLVDCEKKQIRDNKGWAVNLTFEVRDGDYAGQKVFQFLCVGHATSTQAAKIARGCITALCEACGRRGASPGQLYGVPFMLKVAVRKDGDKHYNDVKGYYPISHREMPGKASPSGPEHHKPLNAQQQVIKDAQDPNYHKSDDDFFS